MPRANIVTCPHGPKRDSPTDDTPSDLSHSPPSSSPAIASKLFRLDGRIALVTGGGTGIGLMISQGLAEAGAKVYITGRRLEVLKKVSEGWKSGGESGRGEILPLQMDAVSKESIMGVKKTIEENEGKLHVLVNNAGIVGPVSKFFNQLDSPEHASAETLGQALFDNESFEAWENVYRTNTFSIFFTTTALLGLLEKGSKDMESWSSVVINTTSISGLMKLAQDHFAYNTAKGAASHLTRMLSTELALKKVPVRVNAIAPGVYASEMTWEDIKPEEVDRIGKGVCGVPQKRAGTAEEMAGTAVYLASKAGAYANGQEIAIDGGYLAVNP